MRKIVSALVILLLSCALFECCLGAAWFKEDNPSETQKSIVILGSSGKLDGNPICSVILCETDKDNIWLTVRVLTMALMSQDAHIETWLTIDDHPQKELNRTNLVQIMSAAGAMWTSEYNSTLNGLGDGNHFLTIRVVGNYTGPGGGKYDFEGNATITIDNTAPTIGNISIKNVIYTNPDLELSCTTNEPFAWIAYSLDNRANVTIKTNSPYDSALNNTINEPMQVKTNLSDLTEGSHGLIIYANDTAGNMAASQTITFTVNTALPAIIVIAVVLTAVSVIVVSLIVRKRRRRIN